jgi:hypothetical protein
MPTANSGHQPLAMQGLITPTQQRPNTQNVKHNVIAFLVEPTNALFGYSQVE